MWIIFCNQFFNFLSWAHRWLYDIGNRRFSENGTWSVHYIQSCDQVGDIITAQKMKFSIKDFFSKCDQIRRKLQIWSHLLKKSVMENFIFCAVDLMAILAWAFTDQNFNVMTFIRTNCWKVFCEKGVLKNFAEFTRKHVCKSPFFNKVAGLSLLLY